MILVCGEALIDLFVETGEGRDARRGLPALAVAGGSPFNVAVGVSRLGVRSGFLGGLSSDAFGRMLTDRLAAEAVDLTYVKTSQRPTSLAVVATGAGGHPTYSFYADDCAHADVALADLPEALSDDVAALAMGSFSLSMQPVGSTLAALAAREAGRRVISLDPNLRPALAGDLARWRECFAGLMRHADIVKLSDEDRVAGFGPDANEATLAAGWLAAGCKLVVFTAGPEGATAYHAGGRISVPGRPVRVIDTVGAGDTFHAALLARLARDGCLTAAGIAALDAKALRGLLVEATVAAGITCSRLGADIPSLDDLRATLDDAA